MEDTTDENEPSGHYRTAGQTLMGYGAAASGMTMVLAAVREGALGFIETPAALVICGIMVSVGAALFYTGNREPAEARR